MGFKFPKNQRLSSKKSIDFLFLNKKSLFVFPFRAVYYLSNEITDNSNLQALFVVPKKKFKKATDRNRIRRQLRESFRMNKNPLEEKLQGKENQLQIAFIYVSEQKVEFLKIDEAMKAIISKLIEITC